MANDLTLDALELKVDAAGADAIRVRWLGSASMRDPSQRLIPFLDEVGREAEASGRRLELRFEKLSHFNSATILALVKVAQSLRARGVRLRLVYDAALSWQKLTFEGLRRLDKGDGLFQLDGGGSS